MPPEIADPFRGEAEVPEELHDARGPQFVLQPEEVEQYEINKPHGDS